MPGDVPDPASWVAGATKSELERLLVFLGDAADPGSSATVSRALLIRYISRAPRRVQAALDDLRTGASPHLTRPLSADEREGVCDEAVMAHARMSAHTYVTHYLRTIRAAALDDGSA